MPSVLLLLVEAGLFYALVYSFKGEPGDDEWPTVGIKWVFRFFLAVAMIVTLLEAFGLRLFRN